MADSKSHHGRLELFAAHSLQASVATYQTNQILVWHSRASAKQTSWKSALINTFLDDIVPRVTFGARTFHLHEEKSDTSQWRRSSARPCRAQTPACASVGGLCSQLLFEPTRCITRCSRKRRPCLDCRHELQHPLQGLSQTHKCSDKRDARTFLFSAPSGAFSGSSKMCGHLQLQTTLHQTPHQTPHHTRRHTTPDATAPDATTPRTTERCAMHISCGTSIVQPHAF
jgi:hypothetical protein